MDVTTCHGSLRITDKVLTSTSNIGGHVDPLDLAAVLPSLEGQLLDK